MPRGPRHLPPEGIFHIIARSNNGVVLCKSLRDFLALKRCLQRYAERARLSIYHYCLMRTHFHLLTEVPDTRLLATTMKALQLSYHFYFHRTRPYRGHLWQSRYRCIYIRGEAHFLQCGRYIELNPVYAGLVAGPEQYPWSSCAYYAEQKRDDLVAQNPYLADGKMVALQGRGYRDFVLDGLNLEYQRLKKEFEGKDLA